MGWRGSAAAALVLVLLAAAPSAPAALPGCDAALPLLAAPTRAAQDDADSGRDAPDAADDPLGLAMGAPKDGAQGEYYWGWLDPPVARDGADREDWYVVDLAPVPKVLMLELVSNYTVSDAMGAYGQFRATAYGPGRVVELSSAAGRIELPDDGGRWVVRVSTDLAAGGEACGAVAGGDASLPTSVLQNHGLYVGCRPVCVDGEAR